MVTINNYVESTNTLGASTDELMDIVFTKATQIVWQQGQIAQALEDYAKIAFLKVSNDGDDPYHDIKSELKQLPQKLYHISKAIP